MIVDAELVQRIGNIAFEVRKLVLIILGWRSQWPPRMHFNGFGRDAVVHIEVNKLDLSECSSHNAIRRKCGELHISIDIDCLNLVLLMVHGLLVWLEHNLASTEALSQQRHLPSPHDRAVIVELHHIGDDVIIGLTIDIRGNRSPSGRAKLIDKELDDRLKRFELWYI